MAVQQAILQVMTGRGASGLPEKSVFLGLGGQEEQGTLQEPDEYLRNLLGIYLDGQKRPVCFWLEAAAKGMSLDGFSEKDAKAEWEPGFKESLAYKKPDEYTKMVFGEKMPTGENLEEFQELAKKVIVFGLKQKKKVNPKKEVADASASTEKIKIPHKRGKNIGGSK
jgi:hypothetical protein